MPSLPTLNVPGFPAVLLDPTENVLLVMAFLVIVYVGLHYCWQPLRGVVVASGRTRRGCELLGYDVRLRSSRVRDRRRHRRPGRCLVRQLGPS